MYRKIKNLISLKIENIFEECIKISYSKETGLRYSAFDIKLLFRGFMKNYTKKDICINKHTQRNIQRFVQVNSEWTINYKVDFLTIRESSLI